jgi:hypothetical protein
MRRALLAAIALAALLAPASAGAAYRPTAEIILGSSAPLSAPAITSVMRVPQGDDTTRTITARFPSSFSYNPGLTATGCAEADAAAFACPDSSRIGTAIAKSPFGDGTGTVHLMKDFRLALLFSALGGIYKQRVDGTIRVLDDGSFELTFDGLPQIPITESRIALEGGSRGLLVTPRRCGAYPVLTRFASHGGAAVEQPVQIQVAGCPVPLRVVSAKVSATRVSWALQGAATGTEVTLFRWKRGGWDEVASRRLPATTTTWRLPKGSGRRLVVLRAVGTGGTASPARRVTLKR